MVFLRFIAQAPAHPMRRFLPVAAFMVALFSSPACAGADTSLTKAPMPWNGNWGYQLDSAGRLWLAYYDTGRVLRLRAPDGGERVLVPEDRAQAPSGLALAKADDDVAVLWRDKLPQKGLYLLKQDEPITDALEVAADSQPLGDVTALGTGGKLQMLWLGEKPIPDRQTPYYLYARSLDVSDGALSPLHAVVPGIYPTFAARGNGDLMVFGWDADTKPDRIVARFKPANADQFDAQVVVAELQGAESITPIFRSFRSDDRWFVLWHALYGRDRSDLLLQGAYSDDDGATWSRIQFDGMQGFDVGSLSIAQDNAGHIALGISGIAPEDAARKRHTMRVLRSDDNGTTWHETPPVRPDTPALNRFAAKHPVVAFGAKAGQLIVVWEDWRDIRASLYANISDDGGKTWRHESVRVPHQASNANVALKFDPQSLYFNDDQFSIIAQQATDDSLTSQKLALIQFSTQELADAAAAAAEPPAPRAADDATRAGAASSQSIEEPSDADVDGLPAKAPGSDAATAPADPDTTGAAIAPDTQDEPAAGEQTEEGLRRRVNAFWKAMLAAEHDKLYDFYDPFYRASVPWLMYRSMVGKITYDEYRILDVKIDGPIAKVKTEVIATVPPFRAPTTGERLSLPPRKVPLNDTWLWIDGDWYREYYSDNLQRAYTRFR